MSDRVIAPGARRLAAAWRGGLRPGSRWLSTGATCLALALAFDLGGALAVDAWGGWLRGGIADIDALPTVLAIWLGLLATGLGVAFASALALRTFGAVGKRDPDLPAGVRTPVLATAGLGVAALVLSSTALSPVAGAARAVDASAHALAAVWAHWATHVLAGMGVLLMVAGVAEHLVMRHGLWRDLHMTRAQAREQSRTPGGR